MILFDTSTKSLEIVLNGAVTTNQLPITSSYVDIDQTTFALSAASATDTISNNITAVTAVAAPGSGKTRQLKSLTTYNADTVEAIVKVQLNDNGTLRILFVGTLQPTESLTYFDGVGFGVQVLTFNWRTSTRTTMGGNVVLVAASHQYQFFDPNGSDRTITLPAAVLNMAFVLKHFGTANILTIRDASAVLVTTLAFGNATMVYYDGTAWQVF